MHKLNQKGDLLIALVLVSTVLLGAIGFGVWAYMGMQDYKNNTDEKIADAVKAAEEELSIEKDAQFAEEYKNPFMTYVGPSQFGSLTVTYPKTWSNYVDESPSGTSELSGIMHPRYVSADDKDTNYAFRYEVVKRSYESEMKTFDSKVKNGKVKVVPYRLAKVESILGSRLTGSITSSKEGDMIMLPLRDKTVKIWTEGSDFGADFEKVLETLTFVP